MKVSYYPGCSLHGTGREYDESAQAVCKALDVELCELDDWNCCGASSAHVTDELLSIALPARNLAIAEKKGLELVVPCAACYHALKRAQKGLAEAPEIQTEYRGGVEVKSLLDFLSQDLNLAKITERVKRPLAGLKAVCYYGCLLVRPPKVSGASDWEDPKSMDRLLAALGVEVRPWSYKTDCCGGSLAIPRVDIVKKLTRNLLDAALEAGANCMVTACPLCHANLDTRQEEISLESGSSYELPIFYFTELMGLAFDGKGVGKWLRRHLVDPRKLLSSLGY